jgi:hypothetical protein
VRYFFNVSNGNPAFTDEVGWSFSSPEDANTHAAVVASELAEDDEWAGYMVVVTDEHGTEIARVAIKNRDHPAMTNAIPTD